MYELRGKLSYIQGNLSLLKQMSWVDRETRAVFIEFSVYNPNLNLIMVSTILIEFLSSNSILIMSRFDPLNLFGETGGFSFKTCCEIVLMTFFVYYMIVQLIALTKRDFREYVNDFWSFIEWAIIVLGWVSFVMVIYRLIVAQQVLDFFKVIYKKCISSFLLFKSDSKCFFILNFK